ncbi:MAG: hypothetical protein KME19_16135 [Microcoleus vaginatus WJT46-NPBG5]|nr:hypothetical protein [Microcoleus vaginatus WJT46-NPBG5]
MKFKVLLAIAIANLVILTAFPLPSQLGINPSFAQNSAEVKSWQTYQIPNEFSIRYPSSWFLERSPQPAGATPRELLIITNLKPTLGGGRVPSNLIKTDIAIEPDNLETVVNQMLNSVEPGTRLTRRGKTKVGGREAVRLWFAGANTNTMVTLICYNKTETLFLKSYYQKNNSSLPIIQTIHGSVRAIE